MTQDQSASRSDTEALADLIARHSVIALTPKGDAHLGKDQRQLICDALRAFARSEQQPSDTARLKWLLDDYRRVDLYNAIGTMSYDLDVCRKAIDKAMQSERTKP